MKLVGTVFLIVGAVTVIVVAVPRILPDREEDRASWPYVIAKPAIAATARQSAEPNTPDASNQRLGDIGRTAPVHGLEEQERPNGRTTRVLATRPDSLAHAASESDRGAAHPAAAEVEPAAAEEGSCRTGSPLRPCCIDWPQCCHSCRYCRRLARRQCAAGWRFSHKCR
jgi:hypothetical protein